MAVAESFVFDAGFLRKLAPTPLCAIRTVYEARVLPAERMDQLALEMLEEARRRRREYGCWKRSPAASRLALDLAYTINARGRSVTTIQRTFMAHAVGVDRDAARRDALERLLQKRGFLRAVRKPEPPMRRRKQPVLIQLGVGPVSLSSEYGPIGWRQMAQLEVEHGDDVEEFVEAVAKFWTEDGFRLRGNYSQQRHHWREAVPKEVDALPANCEPKIVTALSGYPEDDEALVRHGKKAVLEARRNANQLRHRARYASYLLITSPIGITAAALAVWALALGCAQTRSD